MINIIDNNIILNSNEKKNLVKMLESNEFRAIININFGFRDIDHILDFISIVSAISYVTKEYNKYKGYKKPKGIRTKLFYRQLRRKSFNQLIKIFPYIKNIPDIDKKTDIIHPVIGIFDGLGHNTLSKLMRCSLNLLYVPKLIGSVLVTTDVFKDMVHKK